MVNPKYAKPVEYRGVIQEIASQGRCPFCPENFRYHKHPVLKKKNDWLITKNSWPYAHTRDHFVIISASHKESLGELSLSDLTAVKSLADWAINRFKIKGGALAVRFGDTDYTGATVCHLHFHLIVPKKSQTVNFPVG